MTISYPERSLRTERMMMGCHTLREEPEPHYPQRSAARSVGQSTGTHRVVGKAASRRGMALWPVACVVIIALMALGVLGWTWADGILSTRAEAKAAGCSEGNSRIKILVAPTVERPVVQAAAKWNDANTVVHAHCIHVEVQAAQSERVLNALTGRTELTTIGGLPAAWIPESSYWVSDLPKTKPEIIGSPAQSVASGISADYPFLALAGVSIDPIQRRATQAFRQFLKQAAQQKDFTDAGIRAI